MQMTKINDWYHRLLRRRKLAQVVLPTELFTFPLGLTLGVLLSAPLAWLGTVSTLALGVLLVYLLGGLRANRSGVLRSLGVLGLWGLLLLIVPLDQSCSLESQALLLVSYLLSSLLVALYRWWRDRHTAPEARLCVRGRVLRAERLRFEGILVIFSLSALAFIGICFQFCPVELRILLFWAGCFIATFTWGVYALETTHLVWVQRRLMREDFIPVLDDERQLIGRVATSEPKTAEGRLPVVRLVATSCSMVYLERRPATVQLPAMEGCDTPFVRWLTEGWTPELLAQRMIDERFCGIRRARPRFLLHYHEVIGGQAVSVFLFGVAIDEPDQLLIDCLPQQGRWWPVGHLAQQSEHCLFSPYLHAEYPYLEQTLLLAERLRTSAPSSPSTDD